jgi:hypothetical protein
MGSNSSGNINPHKKTCVEDVLKLNINRFSSQLTCNKSFTVLMENIKKTIEICLIDSCFISVSFQVTYKSKKHLITQKIKLDKITLTNGGYRYFLICNKCNKRFSALFIVKSSCCFSCKKCLGLTYNLSQVKGNHLKRALHLKETARKKLSEKGILLENNRIIKPKRMRKYTYNRLLKKYMKAEQELRTITDILYSLGFGYSNSMRTIFNNQINFELDASNKSILARV